MTSTVSTAAIRAALINRQEIALLDVREEGIYAEAHPLFAASLPAGRIELETFDRVPRLNTRVAVYDAGEGLAERAAARLRSLGYTDVSLLEGGLEGWRRAGGELFRDVNVPSKAFGELVESRQHTPSLPAEELNRLLDSGADLVVLDARRFDEYQTMSIPTGISVPGAELVYRVGDIAPRAETMVVVNCAGRTRSIIGTQSLVNAGIPNRVAALRNGTIGWKLAGLTLDHGQARRFPHVDSRNLDRAKVTARSVADRASVGRIDRLRLTEWEGDRSRTVYRFDVRTPDEFVENHVAGFRSTPGGQLVQETDVYAPVRGARIVLFDNHAVRADMTGSWLAQMGWDVHVLDGEVSKDDFASGPWHPNIASLPASRTITPAELDTMTTAGATLLDFATSVEYLRGHIPGAWFTPRTGLDRIIASIPKTDQYVLTSSDSVLASFAAPEVATLTGSNVVVLAGGTEAWRGRPLEAGPTRLASPIADVYKRPYEGTDNARFAMEAYLEWEFGLVAQLERDGTHGFRVI